MHGMRCADPAVETFASIEALAPDAISLLQAAGGLFDTAAWWRVVLAHAIPAGSTALFVVIRSSGRAVAAVPMLRSGGQLSSLTTPYTCAYRPSVAPDVDRATRIRALAAWARFCRRRAIVRLDALPIDWGGLAELEAGSRLGGLVPLRFNHFGNWSEGVAGLAWADYLQRRPGALRETIRRRLRRADKLADAGFDMFATADQMDAAGAAFESVYARSWKEPEPFPQFNVALMRAMAASGWLRLGVWSVGTVPVAVQFWVVKDGHAIVLKLAHDEAFKAHSPGTVLTALMLRHLLDIEHVARIDFGRGDDAYKQGWSTDRRQHIGLLLVNPWRPAGLLALLRHTAGRMRDALRSRGRFRGRS
jgi:CelD/BcsL family acetyltransferase involved in cellulose biosynthesis